MKINDNSVNIKMRPAPKSTYHHGDLRSEAIAAGLFLLRDRAAEDISLREIARHVGVSATALYRHFPDKGALLDAMAMEALEQLGRNQAASAAARASPRAAFERVGISYVEWALANPALFRLVFARCGLVDLRDGDPNALGEAFRQLSNGIASVLPETISADDRMVAALHAWSLVHGLALLILDGQVANDPKLIERVVTMARFG